MSLHLNLFIICSHLGDTVLGSLLNNNFRLQRLLQQPLPLPPLLPQQQLPLPQLPLVLLQPAQQRQRRALLQARQRRQQQQKARGTPCKKFSISISK